MKIFVKIQPWPTVRPNKIFDEEYDADRYSIENIFLDGPDNPATPWLVIQRSDGTVQHISGEIILEAFAGESRIPIGREKN